MQWGVFGFVMLICIWLEFVSKWFGPVVGLREHAFDVRFEQCIFALDSVLN